jgi:hypothetical protein
LNRGLTTVMVTHEPDIAQFARLLLFVGTGTSGQASPRESARMLATCCLNGRRLTINPFDLSSPSSVPCELVEQCINMSDDFISAARVVS